MCSFANLTQENNAKIYQQLYMISLKDVFVVKPNTVSSMCLVLSYLGLCRIKVVCMKCINFYFRDYCMTYQSDKKNH